MMALTITAGEANRAASSNPASSNHKEVSVSLFSWLHQLGRRRNAWRIRFQPLGPNGRQLS
jgi:hypothetical protein